MGVRIMLLKEVARPTAGEEDTVRGSSLPESEEISKLTAEQLCTLGETIYLKDEQERITGSISKETLEYLMNRQNKERLIKLLGQIEDGIVAVDQEGRIYYANKAYTTLLGVPLHRIMGKLIQDIEPTSLLNKVLLTRTEQRSGRQLISSIGKYVSLHAIPLWDQEEFLGAVSVFQDVTEFHILNKEVRRITDIAGEYSRQLKNLKTINKLGIVTQNKDFMNLLSQAAIVAKTDAPVLIRGENGTGKEVLANYIYQCSERKGEPLIIVNCAAIPAELLESELFGYEEGAFTGALKGGKKGQFELADKGTIFLDEIGDMPLPMQSKLLRVIQYGEIEKLGRQKKISVDVRILAATNQPLEELIPEKKFRQDLFFRLNTFTLHIPPLRERPEDAVLLADHFLAYYNQKYKKSFQLSHRAYESITKGRWPGNVRELQGCIERMVVLEDEELLDGNDEKDRGETESKESLEGTMKEQMWAYEEKLLKKALEEHGGNRTLAMEALGLNRRTFFRKLAAHGLSK